jgi:UDP-glucose 4-epimerase
MIRSKKNKKKYRILITGASGYIGSCLSKFLNQNYIVALVDKKKLPIWSINKKIPFFKCDILDKKKIYKIFKITKPNIVIHLAAQSTVDEKIPLSEYYSNNVTGTLNLIEVMKNNNINKIIFSSTAAVYKKKSKKISENDKVKPISKYGKTKLTAEQLIQKEKSINSIILRFFNVCSALKNTLIGELHQPETHLIPSSVSRAEKNIPINIFGKNYPTKDGTCVRDYIHIQDICDAIQKSIQTYSGLYINLTNIYDLYNHYKNQNDELFSELKDESSDTLTNERKTYYEDQGIDSLNFWYYYILLTIYIIFSVCFGVLSFIYPSPINWKYRVVILLGLVILPFISTYLLNFALIIVYYLYELLPKNVRLTVEPPPSKNKM